MLRLRQPCKHLSWCEYLPAEISTKHNRYFPLTVPYYRSASILCIRYGSSSWFHHKVAYSWQMAGRAVGSRGAVVPGFSISCLGPWLLHIHPILQLKNVLPCGFWPTLLQNPGDGPDGEILPAGLTSDSSGVTSQKIYGGQECSGGQNVWFYVSNSIFVWNAAFRSTEWLDILKSLGGMAPRDPLRYAYEWSWCA